VIPFPPLLRLEGVSSELIDWAPALPVQAGDDRSSIHVERGCIVVKRIAA
jgi:hypothetical protein